MKVFIVFLIMSGVCLAERSNVWVDLEEQKKLYQRESWDQFFGRALYYRIHESKKEKLIVAKYDHFVALELLALARHCQWGALTRLAEEVGGQDSFRDFVKIKKALSVIALKKEYKGYLSDQKTKDLDMLTQVSQSRDLWRSDVETFSKFTSSKKLRVRVVSLCE